MTRNRFLQPEFPAKITNWPTPAEAESPKVSIVVYEQDLTPVAEIEDYLALNFIRRWSKPGEFEIQINRHSLFADELTLGRLIVIDGMTNKCGLIRHREIVMNQNGKASEIWSIKGYTLSQITEQRITVPPDLDYDVVTDAAETIMKAYVKNNITEPQNDPFDERSIDIVQIATDAGKGSRTRWQTRYKNLAQELELISIWSGLGWDIRPNLTTEKWIFEVYAGVDRSTAQTDRAPVVFSVDYDTLAELRYLQSVNDYRNLAYVAGQGEGAAREIARVAGDSYEAVRIESTDDHWNAGTLTDVQAVDDELILSVVTPAGVDVDRTESLATHWNNYAYLDGLAADGDTLISVREPIEAGSQFYTSGTGTWTVPDGVYLIDLLVVGGGGGRGGAGYGGSGGGGGAGGLIYLEGVAVTPGQTYNYAVGEGGQAGSTSNGSNGDNSSFGSYTANGGGGGGLSGTYTGRNGGCGGGGGFGASNLAGGSRTQPVETGNYGNNGGGGNSSYPGGGGGAGSAGVNRYGGAGLVVKGTTYAAGGGPVASSVPNSGNGTRDDGDDGVVKIWWAAQTGTGYRISQPLSLNTIVTAADSEITIAKVEPVGYDGTAKVYAQVTSSTSVPAVDSPSWVEQTTGSAITAITPTESYVGKYLWIMQVIEIAVINDPSPYFTSIVVDIDDVGITYYEPEGERTSPALALEGAVKAAQSLITWSAIEPAGTDLTIGCAVNTSSTVEPADEDYTEATSGSSIPGINTNDDMSGKYLWVRQTLEADADDDATPRLDSLSVSVLGSELSNKIDDCVFNPDDTITADGEAHQVEDDQRVMFIKTGANPAEIVDSQWYYVVNAGEGDTFQVSETEGGSAVEFTGNATYTGEYYEDVSVLPVGIERYELFVDARDLADDEHLPGRGKRKLAEHIQTAFLEGQILTQSMFKLGVDYNLGDTVTVQNEDWNVGVNSRVTEVQESWESKGYDIRLTFGNQIPDLISKLKAATSGADNEVRR